MEDRGIDRSWIEVTVTAPDWIEPDPRHVERTRSYKAISDMGSRVLRVVHWREADHIVVLTAHCDRDAMKRRPRQ